MVFPDTVFLRQRAALTLTALLSALELLTPKVHSTGTVTDTYTCNAYGIELAATGSTPNHYRFTGEQWDSDLGVYYLRARYCDPDLGRFWTMDTCEGSLADPKQE